MPFPNERQLWVNFRSPLVWDLIAIMAYLTVRVTFGDYKPYLPPRLPQFGVYAPSYIYIIPLRWSPIMEWFVNSPAAIIAVVTALIGIGIWIGKVTFNLSALNTSLSDFMKEIRTDIKKYLSGYLLLHSRKIVRFD